jgi:hypothetical protein
MMTINCRELIFSGHAVRRMFQRGLTTREVKEVMEFGEIIAYYPDDVPFPSYLMLHWIKNHPIHVVVAYDPETRRCLVITAYMPHPSLWNLDFKTRRKP